MSENVEVLSNRESDYTSDSGALFVARLNFCWSSIIFVLRIYNSPWYKCESSKGAKTFLLMKLLLRLTSTVIRLVSFSIDFSIMGDLSVDLQRS